MKIRRLIQVPHIKYERYKSEEKCHTSAQRSVILSESS